MQIQFAFNPKKKSKTTKKRLASKNKKFTLKKAAKRPKLKLSVKKEAKMKKKARRKFKMSTGRKKSTTRRRKSKRNPQLIFKKTLAGRKKATKEYSQVFPTSKQLSSLVKKVAEYESKYKAAPMATKSKRAYAKKLVAAKHALSKAESAQTSALKERDRRVESGWKLSGSNVKYGAKTSKKKKSGKKKSGKKKSRIAKKLKKLLVPQEATVAKKKKSKHKKAKHKKAHKKAKHKKSRRKSAKRSGAKRKSVRRSKRKYAKRYTHSHSRKVRHIKKGSTLRGLLKSKKRGGPVFRVVAKLNPFGGKMKIQDYTGHSVEELGSLAVGGALYSTVNTALRKYVPMIATYTDKVPVVGQALLPALAGALLVKFASKMGPASKAAKIVGEGLVAASVVGAGVSAAQMIPGLSGGLSGVLAFPMSGINYSPNSMNGVDYTPNRSMGIMPQLAGNPDFGSADYGGSGGYTEAHKFRSADFGADDEDEYVGLGNSPDSQMG